MLPWQTGQVAVSGGAPNTARQPQNILVHGRQLSVNFQADDCFVIIHRG